MDLNFLSFLVFSIFLCEGLAEDPQNDAEGRHLSKHKCQFGSCGGGYGGYGGFGGFGGYQGGYNPGYQGYPPINIGISQSQASSSDRYGGGYPYYQNNQYNGYQGYPNYGSYPGFGYNPGHGPYNRPFGGNGFGPNNQYNGNYYLGNTGNGYGLVRRFIDDYDNYDEDYSRSASKKD